MSSLAPHPSTAPDGFIVVAVLWTLAALATLVSIYAVYVMDTAKAFPVHEYRLQSEALVSAAVELVAFQLISSTPPPAAQAAQSTTSASAATPPLPTKPTTRPTHGAFNFRMANANVEVTFQSEDARIDLNAAPKELLAGLFTAIGANPDGAANYAERVVRWRTPIPRDQVLSDVSGTPHGARFSQVDELSLVPGLPNIITERALPFVTVFSGRPQVNVLEAAPEVLASLPKMNQDRLNDVLAKRKTSSDGQTLLQLLGPAQGYATLEGSNASRVAVHITYPDGRSANSEVIILPFDEGNEPFAILSWRDELESPRSDQRGMASR